MTFFITLQPQLVTGNTTSDRKWTTVGGNDVIVQRDDACAGGRTLPRVLPRRAVRHRTDSLSGILLLRPGRQLSDAGGTSKSEAGRSHERVPRRPGHLRRSQTHQRSVLLRRHSSTARDADLRQPGVQSHLPVRTPVYLHRTPTWVIDDAEGNTPVFPATPKILLGV